MFKKIKFPSPLSILMIVIVLAAGATWLLPAGNYQTLEYEKSGRFALASTDTTVYLAANQQVLDNLGIRIELEKFTNGDIRKPVSIPGTYQKQEQNKQSVLEILQAPIRGIYEAVEIIILVLFIGGFIEVFNYSGAIKKGVSYLSYKMKGREMWLIVISTFLFSLGGSTFGMAEEGMAFYPILIPVFIAAGYDLLIPVSVIFIGNSIGFLASTTNPFATIIASNAAGINWTNGLYGRTILFFILTTMCIVYIVRYAQRVKNNPALSLVSRYEKDIIVATDYHDADPTTKLDRTAVLTLTLFASTFIVMVIGVVLLDWWLLEMTALFFASTLILGFILRMDEKKFIQNFIKGAEGLLSVALIIGFARGVTIVLNEGRISDTILFYCANSVSGMPGYLFIIALLFVYMLLTIFISSSSGMAVLTMPIIGPLAVMVGVPGEQIVNAYLLGMGIMGFITPVGLILPALAMVNVSFKTWLRFIWPLLLMITLTCIVFLVIGVV